MVYSHRIISLGNMLDQNQNNRTSRAQSAEIDTPAGLSRATFRDLSSLRETGDLKVALLELSDHLSRIRAHCREGSYPALMATARGMRIAAMAGETSPIIESHVHHVREAVFSANPRYTAPNVVQLIALIEYGQTFPAQSPEGEIPRALKELHEISAYTALTSGVRRCSQETRLTAALGLISPQLPDQHLAHTIVRSAAAELAVRYPQHADFYGALHEWRRGRFHEAGEILDRALASYEKLPRTNEDLELTRSYMLETQIRISLGLHNIDQAEAQAFALVRRVNQLGQSHEIIRRCNYYLSQIYIAQGRTGVAESLLEPHLQPAAPGQVREHSRFLASLFERKS